MYSILKMLKDSNNIDDDISSISEDLREKLFSAKVILTEFDEQNFAIQKKFVKYERSLQRNVLGLIILPTFACNFKCPYCYETNLPQVFMDENTENKLIEFAKSNPGCCNTQLCWHGGEPLVAFNNIKRLLGKLTSDDKIRITKHSMVSNGYLLDKEKCEFLNAYNLDSIQITVDGLRDNHNKSRIHKNGTPTFDVILNNVENVFKYIPKCYVVIRMNVHSENQFDYPILKEELKKLWGNQPYFLDMRYVVGGDDSTNDSGCRIKCFKNRDKIHFLKKMYEEYNCSNISFYPKPNIGGCTATHINSFVIAPNGDLYKCWADVGKQERKTGSIFKGYNDSVLLSEYLVGTDMFSDKKCSDCLLLPVCDGGCNLTRLEYKQNKKEYDECPIDTKDLDLLFDMFYEQRKNELNKLNKVS